MCTIILYLDLWEFRLCVRGHQHPDWSRTIMSSGRPSALSGKLLFRKSLQPTNFTILIVNKCFNSEDVSMVCQITVELELI